MKIRNIIYAIAAMTFAACSSESLDTPASLTINATIDGVATRAEVTSVNDIGEIGVYTNDRSNILFKLSNGTTIYSEAKIYVTSEDMVVKAYYPYINSGTESINTTDQDDVSDYLYAEGTASVETGTADLKFHHLMSKLTLNVSYGEGYSSSESLSHYSIEVSGIKTTGTFTAPDDVVATGGENELMVQDCWESPATLLVIPQDIKSFTLTVLIDRNSFSATVPVKGGKLEDGKNYIFTAKVDKEKLTVSSSSVITGWDKKEPADVNVIYSGD
jgi:hypothetical protein